MPPVRKVKKKWTRADSAALARKSSPLLDITKNHPEKLANSRSKGGVAAQASNKRRRTLAQMMKTLLDQPAIPGILEDTGLRNIFPDTDPTLITYGMLLTAAVAARGISTGRHDQYAVIRDTIGEKPKDSMQITGEDGQPLNPPTVNVLFNSDKKKEK